MKRFLSYTALAVLALAVLVYVGLTFFLGSAVKAGVNRIGPKLTQTRVTLDGATISPLTGTGTLTGLSVDNPAGWTTGHAIYLGRVHISMKPFSLFGDHIIIDEIEIDQPEFTYETKIFASNINDLLKNVESGVSGDQPVAETAKKNGQPIKFEVRHFRLLHGRVTVGVGATAVALPMPSVELKELGTANGGITADQLAAAVMKSVTTSVVGATTQAAGQIGTTAGAAMV